MRDLHSGSRRRFPLAVLTACLALLGPGIGTASAAGTVVSLTFDDGRQTQYSTRGTLAAHGMHGTFFVNSGLVGVSTSSGHMTWAQMHDLAFDGNEITGHTLTHADLTKISAAEAQHEICDDRANLLNQGFAPVTSFAYPYGAYNSAVVSVVQQCGYQSARRTGGIRSQDCSNCPFAETIPPLDRWATRAARGIGTDDSLADMQGYVTQAENNGGGWVQILIHQVCDGCDTLSISLSQLNAFLDWLQPRAANGTVVQTVGEVMSGTGPPPPPPPLDTTPPATTMTCNNATCGSGWYRSAVTVRLSASDAGSGVAQTRYTTNGSDPTVSNGTTYTGPFALTNTTTVRFRSWDNAGNVEPVRSRQVRVRIR